MLLAHDNINLVIEYLLYIISIKFVFLLYTSINQFTRIAADNAGQTGKIKGIHTQIGLHIHL